MTLEQASEGVIAAIETAIETEDMEAIARAVEVRGEAIARLIAGGERASERSLELGRQAADSLHALKQRLAFAQARLTQMQAGLAVGLTPG